jgi:hypothetical protein
MTKTLRDGTVAEWCEPHCRWEWDCMAVGCGAVNKVSDTDCQNCGEARVA